MSSSSSTDAVAPADLTTGSEIAGFRVERLLARGPRAAVYEATQLSLGRRVALKLLAPDTAMAERCRRLRWPDHPNVVTMFAAGAGERGPFVAMALVRGSSLARERQAGRVSAARETDLLDQVAAALAAAHRVGIVHGRLHAGNVLIGTDGRALVTDFNLGTAGATPEDDLAALAVLRRGAGTAPPDSTPARRAPRRALVLTAAGAALAAAVALALSAGSDPPRDAAVTASATPLGSSLGAGPVASVDCNGRAPTGSSPLCTVMQTRLRGAPTSVPRDGVVRGWTVLGAGGEVALEVLRRDGAGLVPVAHTEYASIPDQGRHRLPANLSVRAGDLVGLRVAPGATIGVRRGARGAATARLFGPPVAIARVPRLRGFDHELLLRVDYVPGAVATVSGRLTGRAAALAPAGTVLRTRDVEVRPGLLRTVAVVEVAGKVVVDLLDGRRRLSRVPMPDARTGGRLASLIALGRPVVTARWRNPDGRAVSHSYDVGTATLTPQS